MSTVVDNRVALEWKVYELDRGGWCFLIDYGEGPVRDGEPSVGLFFSGGPYLEEDWAKERLIEQAARFGLRLKDG